MTADIVVNGTTYMRNGFGEWVDDHWCTLYGGLSDCLDEIERLRGEVERWAWIAADAARSGDALMQHMRRYDDLALKRWREEPIRER